MKREIKNRNRKSDRLGRGVNVKKEGGGKCSIARDECNEIIRDIVSERDKETDRQSE